MMLVEWIEMSAISSHQDRVHSDQPGHSDRRESLTLLLVQGHPLVGLDVQLETSLGLRMAQSLRFPQR